jgi:methionyl-tRNA formyltransferase
VQSSADSIKLLLFGDTFGLPISLKVIDHSLVCGLVAAETRHQQHSELRRMATLHGLPLLIQPRKSSANYTAFVENIRIMEPDIILVNSYSMLLRPEVLAIPTYGSVNIHCGLLPQYRTCHPIQWTIINDESETGVTMHYMSKEFDTGDIIAQRRVPILFDDTWLQLQDRLALVNRELLKEEIPKLIKGTNDRQPQDESLAGVWKVRRPEDGMIDWSQSVRAIYNLVRALVKPLPGAFYISGEQKVVLDNFHTIPQIVYLKFGAAGNKKLQTDRLIFSPFLESDLPFLSEWVVRNELILDSFLVKLLVDKRYKKNAGDIYQPNNIVLFVIRLLETSELIGFCLFSAINYLNQHTNAHICICPENQRGKGYETETALLLKKFALNELALSKVCLHLPKISKRDIREYEKIGFKREESLNKNGSSAGGREAVDGMLIAITNT